MSFYSLLEVEATKCCLLTLLSLRMTEAMGVKLVSVLLCHSLNLGELLKVALENKP